MNCFDCATRSLLIPAVASCRLCGAGVCLDCARVGTQIVRHPVAFGASLAGWATTLRTIACIPCAHSRSEHNYRAVPLPGEDSDDSTASDRR